MLSYTCACVESSFVKVEETGRRGEVSRDEGERGCLPFYFGSLKIERNGKGGGV